MIIHSWITTWPFFGYYMCLFVKEKKKMPNTIPLKINPQHSYFLHYINHFFYHYLN
jgi:hypothetical protein